MWGGLASQAAQVSEAGEGGSGGLWGYPGMAVAFLHFQLRGPGDQPFSLSMSDFYIVASFSAPAILAAYPVSTWLSQAPKRSAHEQLGGCCMSPQAQWEDCHLADVTSARRTRLILLQGGTLSNRNKHQLCWGQTRQGPLEGSAPLAPVLLPWQPPLQASVTH